MMKRSTNMQKPLPLVSSLEVEVGERSDHTGTGRELRPVNPEVLERAMRRRFSAEYKLRILKLADSCAEPGSLGALLRREGLYASNLKTWRRQRDEGTLEALRPKKRGRKAIERNPLALEVERLRRENEKLSNRLKQAELIIDVQKKISQMLGVTLESPGNKGNA